MSKILSTLADHGWSVDVGKGSVSETSLSAE